MPDVILTGLPRSGSTLTCHLLNRCDDTVALHEPIPMADLAREFSGEALPGQVARFYADTRRSLLETRRALSKRVDGKVPDNTFGEARGGTENLRRSLASHGEVSFEGRELSPDFLLAIKHNAGFAAMLERLTPQFRVFRHRAASAGGVVLVEQRQPRGAARARPRGRTDRPGFARGAGGHRRPHRAAVLHRGMVFRAVRTPAAPRVDPALRGHDRLRRKGAGGRDPGGGGSRRTAGVEKQELGLRPRADDRTGTQAARTGGRVLGVLHARERGGNDPGRRRPRRGDGRRLPGGFFDRWHPERRDHGARAFPRSTPGNLPADAKGGAFLRRG